MSRHASQIRIAILVVLIIFFIWIRCDLYRVYDLLPQRSASIEAITGSTQLVIVLSEGWTAQHGEMYRFERADSLSEWIRIGSIVTVGLGSNGMGWGFGLHDRASLFGPLLSEANRRSPAGVFRINGLFGFGKNDPGLSLPYREILPTTECVDDIRSPHYNQIVENNALAKPDWVSAERMFSYPGAYGLGILFDQNTSPIRADGGSCLFLHAGGVPAGGTFGCTTMEASEVLEVAQWLKADHHPLLVQLPQGQYLKLKGSWTLPNV